MAEREFTITETPSAGGTFTETPARFTWTAREHTIPEEAWELPLRVRTVRADYAGSDEPVEQVLGPNFEPFDLHGVWDDRYAGAGAARRIWQAFEEMVLRTNEVRLEFEGISITGLITHFVPRYRRRWQVFYTFTVSPHRKRTGGDARRQPLLAPSAPTNPATYVDRAGAVIDSAVELHAEAPVAYVGGDLVAQVGAVLTSWQSQRATLQSLLSGRVLATAPQAVNSVSRLAQAFFALQVSAASLPPLLADTSSADALAYEDAINMLAFDGWSRGIATRARQLLLLAHAAAADLARRVDPQALAFYSPHAGESLYAISNRFYRTPHRWREIAERNRLFNMTLAGTELLEIPR